MAVAMHYKEYGRTKNTAKLIPLALPQSSQLYSHPVETPALLERMQDSPSLVLWPGEGSKPASEYREWLRKQESRVLLTVLDGTWVSRGSPCRMDMESAHTHNTHARMHTHTHAHARTHAQRERERG